MNHDTTPRRFGALLITGLIALLAAPQAGCFLGLMKRENRRTRRNERNNQRYEKFAQKTQDQLKQFMARGVPTSAAELKTLHRDHSRLQSRLSRKYVPGGKAYRDRFQQWADTVRPKVDTYYLKILLTGVRRLGKQLPRGGHGDLIIALRRQQKRRWRGPRVNLWPDIRRTNIQRVLVTQQTFSPTGGYFQSRGCVASLRPLPRSNRRLPITFHLPATGRVYMRCYLKSTVGGMQQGRARFRLYGKARRPGARGSVRVPIDISVGRRNRYVDFSFDLGRLSAGRPAGVIYAGFEYRYADGYRREYSGNVVRIVPNYRGLFVYGSYTFEQSARAGR